MLMVRIECIIFMYNIVRLYVGLVFGCTALALAGRRLPWHDMA